MDLKTNETLTQVIDYCHEYLYDDREAVKYLFEERKLNKEIVAKFKIGSFPSNIFRLLKIFDPKTLQDAGIIHYENGSPCSKFTYNRIIVPIYDVHGRALGIIGRTLLNKDDQVKFNVNKYDNTRFPKTNCLFGLNLAKTSARQENKLIIVEGNFDVISAHQKGITNVVATSSSWFTKNQASLAARYVENVEIMFDNDEAGRKSTERYLKQIGITGIKISERQYPGEYKDPDEYFRSLK